MSFRIIRSIIKEAVGIRPGGKKGERLKTDTPLDQMCVGAVIQFDSIPFINARNLGSFVEMPGELTCVAAGRIVDGPFFIHRFYLLDRATDSLQMIVAMTESDKLITESVFLYKILADEDPTDWDPWLVGTEQEPPMIGGSLLKWENPETGEITEYPRLWKTNVEGSVQPDTVHEKIYFHRYNPPRVATHLPMLYARDLGDGIIENILIGVIMDGGFNQHKDGKYYNATGGKPTQMWIEGHVGIAVDPKELVVIGS